MKKKLLEISFYICVPKITIIWCTVSEIQNEAYRIFCHFWPFFALLPPNDPKNQNFETMKKIPGDIIILHMCTINDNHMMYGYWDMERNGQNFLSFLSFWTLFCPFTSPPLTSRKIKISKKWKNHWRYHFTHVYHKWQSYDVCFLRYGARQT